MGTRNKALVVGIDYYEGTGQLFGCVSDAHNVRAVLAKNSDGSVNFDVEILTGTGPSQRVTRRELREKIKALFSGKNDIALFYFAGHGHIAEAGGYLIATDSHDGEDGIPLSELLTYANQSKTHNRVIVLDSCHSGIAGSAPSNNEIGEIKKGTTILTASTAEQYADEVNDSGVFTTLFVDALEGAAGNLVGDVTPGAVYAHIDQSLGTWDQRPVFKTNIEEFISLRRVNSSIALNELQRLAEFFPNRGDEFQLDPSFEPERQGKDASVPAPDPTNTAIFAILQKFNRVGLVVPGGGALHMWHAAMQSKTCKLTVLGEHYRRLAASGRI